MSNVEGLKYPDWQTLVGSYEWGSFFTDPEQATREWISRTEKINEAEAASARISGNGFVPLVANKDWGSQVLELRSLIRGKVLQSTEVSIRIKSAEERLDPEAARVRVPGFEDSHGPFKIRVGELVVAMNVRPESILAIANRPPEGSDGGLQVLSDSIARKIVVFKDGIKMLKGYDPRPLMGSK